MLLGLVMLTASWGTNLQGWVICYAWSLFVYGEFRITDLCCPNGENQSNDIVIKVWELEASIPSQLPPLWRTQLPLANCPPGKIVFTAGVG